MARHWFGGSQADQVATRYDLGSHGLVALAAGAKVTFYDAETDGTQYVDLLLDGITPGSFATTDDDGYVPRFQGPDAVQAMWADVGSDQPRRIMVTTDAAIDLSTQLATRIATVEKGAVNGVAELDASGKVVQPVPAANVENPPWVQKGALVLHVKDYGAVGDGIADDSAAVGAWIDAILAAEGVGYMSPGDYLLNSAVVRNGVDGKRFAIIGAGLGVSRFIIPATNVDGGLHFNSTTTRDAQMIARDFTIVTQGVGNGTGLKFSMPGGGAQHQTSATLANIEVKGEDITQDVFDVGIDLAGNWRPHLIGVKVAGPWGPGVSSNLSDTSPLFVGTAALVLDDSYDYTVDSCHFWGYSTVVRDIGTAAEAGRIVNSVIAEGKVGFDRFRTDPEPIIWVDNCHFNNRDINIRIDGAKLAVVRGCHPYNQDTTDIYAGTMTDFLLKNTERTIIANNVFHYDGAPDRIHIDIDTAVLGNSNLIESNIFGSTGANAVRIGAGSARTLITHNIYPGTYTKRISDLSAAAVILDIDAGELSLESQASSAAAGPVLALYRDSASPAANDQLGRFRFLGRDSAGNKTEYGFIGFQAVDVTDATEDASAQVWAMVNGTLTRVVDFQATGGTDTTGMFLLVNRGGTVSLQRVVLGAADSGGAGFRVLRVSN